MTTIQYLQFVTVAECKNITKAAKKLMVAQPALTNQIKHLEEELGTALFIRSHRSVELTEAGRVFYESAVRILQAEENVRRDINLLKKGAGTLRLGVTRFLPDAQFEMVLARYKAMYPNVVISLHDDIRDNILKLLDAGTIEIAVVNAPPEHLSNYQTYELSPSQLYACRPRDSVYLTDVAPGEVIPLCRVKNVPLSVPRSLHAYIVNCCQKEGFSPVVDAVSDSRYATLKLAQISNITALLVLNDNALADDTYIVNPVESPNIDIGRYLVTGDGTALTVPAENFLRLLQETY